MVWLKKIKYATITFLYGVWNIITWPYIRIRDEIRFRRRLKELRKRDPFIYK